MVLDTGFTNLWAEIRASEKKRDEHLGDLQGHIDSYTSPWYRGEGGEGPQFDPENTFFNMLAMLVPQLVDDNPRVSMETRRPNAQGLVANAIEWGTNRWSRDTKLKETLTELAYDYGFRWGVALVSEVARPDVNEVEDPIRWPQAVRLSPYDHGWDAQSASYRASRFAFHRYTIDKDDLEQLAEEDEDLDIDEREGWKLSSIQNMTAGLGLGVERAHLDTRNYVERNEVLIYEIWVSEVQIEDEPGPEEGFHGTIFTLAVGQDGEGNINSDSVAEIREPRPFFGPRWGPYIVFGTYTVPDSSIPLSTIVANAGQHQQLNTMVRAADRAIRKYKKLVLVAGEDPSLQDMIAGGEDQYVFPTRNIQSLQGRVAQLEVGGLTEQFVAVLQMYQDRVNRNIGLDDVQRGNVTGAGTATEVNRAVEASLARTGFIRRRFKDSAEELLRSVAWYLYHDDRVIFPLGREANEAFEKDKPEGTDVWFLGGDENPGSGATFDDLELEIEQFSMERANQEQMMRRSAWLVETLMTLGPALPQLAQYTDMVAILDEIGEGYQLEHFSDHFDLEEAAALGQGTAPFATERPIGVLGRQAGSTVTGAPGAFERPFAGINKSQKGLGGAANTLSGGGGGGGGASSGIGAGVSQVA